ncbi:hypothetical protein GCM10025857_21330 [Alicyclobacillus contaminans]|uniref:hypothetical protein n=1 Tax=Alicyclobacillus contaminans TaxID=392016 RepID=UPI000415C4B9|nr:hypothetical protein [Alicyclobacillus contaminans]GMA50776.1 hypothetical protein GCM10025857_21330 [Alicyclobacillus contaminans]
MRERTILASFYSGAEAQKAADHIQAMGVETVQVDQLHALGGWTPPDRRYHPITGDVPSLSTLTLNTEPRTRDAGVLLAVDPAASGMSDGQGNITGRNFLLTVVCPEPLVDKAVEVIRTCNGYT